MQKNKLIKIGISIVLILIGLIISNNGNGNTSLAGILELIGIIILIFTLKRSKQTKQSINTDNTRISLSSKKLIETINTKIVGVTFNCENNTDINRQDLIKDISSLKTKIHLQAYEYNGKPANYVIMDKNGLDIGNLKAELSKKLAEKYANCELKVKIIGLTGGTKDSPTAGCNITIEIYA